MDEGDVGLLYFLNIFPQLFDNFGKKFGFISDVPQEMSECFNIVVIQDFFMDFVIR